MFNLKKAKLLIVSGLSMVVIGAGCLVPGSAVSASSVPG